MDATQLLEWCEAQKNDSAFFDYRKDIDPTTGVLRHVCYVSEQGYQLQQSFPEVLFLDATHGTNVLGMKLVLFITVDGEGLTRVLGASLLSVESTQSFTWMLQSWMELVNGNGPNVVFTDEDEKLRDVCRRVFPKAKLLLCVLHLWQNVIKHLKGCFRFNIDWQNFARQWWNLVFMDDERERIRFDMHWAHLVGYLPSACRSGKSLEIFQQHYQWQLQDGGC